MKLIAKLQRLRLAETRYWLPYEEQIHALLLEDSRTAELREVVESQIESLAIARRSPLIGELAAGYSYDPSVVLWICHRRFDLCRLRAANASGEVVFDGGMIARISVPPSSLVVNPKRFRLDDPKIEQVTIDRLTPEELPESSGWVADFEANGLLVRHFGPVAATSVIPLSQLSPQYVSLFEQCSAASIRLNGEEFSFLSPTDLSIETDLGIGSFIPVLDLRSLGGLALKLNDQNRVVLLVDSDVAWEADDLASAIHRLRSELSTRP